jgi:hypothetical protein
MRVGAAHWLSLAAIALAVSAPSAIAARAPAPAVTQVMVIGTYHMSNPGKDIHDVKADDVLAPKRQKEIAATVKALARFRPTKVAVEWPADIVAERWPKFRAGKLPPSRNEVVQLGFRLAEQAHSEGAWGIDVDGDFPWDQLVLTPRRTGMGRSWRSRTQASSRP